MWVPRLKGVKGVSFEVGSVVKISTHLARHKHDRNVKQFYLKEVGMQLLVSKYLKSLGTPKLFH